MNIYNWENPSRAPRNKAKKTGTVVFHNDEAVDLSFDRLMKEYPIDNVDHSTAEDQTSVKGPLKKAPLMTTATAKAIMKKMGFATLLPCQAQCYRGIFNRRDVILHSRTGSGKTLAYALPIIERHTILEVNSSSSVTPGPFLLIFVFSNELAVQTKGVLEKIYPKLNIRVAGFEDLTSQQTDILIGTVRSIDVAIRGTRHGDKRENVKRNRTTEEEEEINKETEEEEEDQVEDLNDDGDDDDNNSNEGDETSTGGVVKASNIRAIVVDEVDLTLGPRFSNIGRRMRNLLKFIRKANGSLTKGLMTDFRSHHYVLCGATIPNWVIKAGFLGVKKYYYQLVTVGTAKLPDKLECFTMHCQYKDRVETTVRLLGKEGFGRTVVFGTRRQIEDLEVALSTNKVKLAFRSLNPSKDELDRIAAMEDFNSNTASVILCTDLAARGLDFVDVHMVLMLSLPSHNMSVETFVHRAGRTARALHSGKCLLLHDEREKDALEAIQKNAHAVLRMYIPTGTKGKNDGTTKSDDVNAQNLKAVCAEKVSFALTVRNPFKYTKPDAIVPSALEVLKKNLGELFSNTSDLNEENGPETVTFKYPASGSHEVKQKLWKFAIKEIISEQEE
ncbi:RNA helicase [Trypanosoma theileri]|uniref:ATP-dependent RNA helicase n=1 Tax=Trypanosoma theileri TaxID=67003 RepID=A0A1X0NXJ9_9TRYP|nr:RNA helicase [Trypanosoma theileri]ORC89426.1 RNA helicase [Trypanosoma theileri]